MMMMISTDAGSCYVGMKCTHATSLGTFKQWLDEHHPALLRHFASLALLYKTLDLLTYLGTTLEAVLLYGCETWRLSKKQEQEIDGCYTRILRKALNIS